MVVFLAKLLHGENPSGARKYLSNRAPCLRGVERNYACVSLVPAVVVVGRPQLEFLLVVVVVDGAALEAVAARERHLAAVEGFEAYAALIGTAGHVLNRAGGRYLSN